MTEQSFTACESCGKQWLSRADFLSDATLVVSGYQANFIAPEKGLFLFGHGCHGLLSVDVAAFADLYTGPIFTERLSQTGACPGFCLHRNVLGPCPQHCECAYVREILRVLDRSLSQET